MKKILYTAALLLTASSTFAQLHIRGSIGYNLPINSQLIGTESTVRSDPDQGFVAKAEGIYGSYGSGLSFQGAVGGSISDILGYDVEIGFLVGKKYTVRSSSESINDEYEESKSYSRSFQFAPAVVLTSGSGTIQPYTRVGPVLGFTTLRDERSEYDSYFDEEVVTEYKYTGGISIGFKGVVGANFNTDKNLQFFAELSFISMSYAPKEGELTKYTVDGEDALSSIDKEDRKIKFKKEISSNDDGNVDIQQKYSMGSIGLQVGVKYVLK
jgi:hypothetical protein